MKKAAEGIRLAYTRGKVTLQHREHDNNPFLRQANSTIMTSTPLTIDLAKTSELHKAVGLHSLRSQERHGTGQTVIQAASHNYAGFYNLTQEAEGLQRLALVKLPVADT